jgi:hypothetical protein
MPGRTTGAHRVDRPYYFAQDSDRRIFAYTQAEWGLGGAQPFGNYKARNMLTMSIVVAGLTIPALASPVFFVLGVVGLNLGVALLFLVCTLLFTGGWLLGFQSLRGELRARKLRLKRGLPKPYVIVTDDQARQWFTANPGNIAIVRDNFPESTHPFLGE